MTLTEAKAILTKKLTLAHAKEWEQETDKLLWIEYNIFPLADVQSSINTTFGERLADWVEGKFAGMVL